ncbi:MAG: translocation/assembly module TamB [Desulfobacterales bacterium]|nr:translocation/assembly module TamB [Desulfobacterales bacterium]
MSGNWNAPAAALRLTGRELLPSGEALLPPGPYAAEGEALLQGRRLHLPRLVVKGPSAAFEAVGEVTELQSPTDLLSGSAGARREKVSVRAVLRISELGWAARALEGVRRTAGRIEADATLTGPLADPELTADLRLIDGEIGPDGTLPPLHRLGLDAGFSGQRLEIRSLKGEAGGAPFRITGELAAGAPETQAAALRIEGDNLLLFRSETVTLRADTRLSLTGPLSALVLKGELAITDGRLSTRWRFLDTFLTPGRPASEGGLRLFSIQAPPFRDMRFEVRISSKSPFRLRTNVARGEVRPDLLLAGTGESPMLTGVVYVDPGRLSLPSTTLKIESGLIRFLPADPERPVVNLMGTGRIYGFDINLRVEGPYDAPEIFLSSVPPLAHEELLWMLLTGEPPRQEAALSESQQAGMKVAVFVGRDFITHWLESALPESDESVLDRLDVEVGRSVSRTGQQTIEARFRLAEGFLRQGDALYLVGDKDIYDTYNMGVRLVFRFQ